MITIAQAKKGIFDYGVYTMLLILEHLEDVQDYESCKIIVEAIKETEIKYDFEAGELPTRIGENTFEELSASIHYSEMHDRKLYEDMAKDIINGKVKL